MAGGPPGHGGLGPSPLPLRLHREAPEVQALLQGLRESLSEEEFREGLLLAALPLLPPSCALPATETLFQKGLLQRVPAGYRLHPLLKEMALSVLREEVQEAVRRAEGRLPPEVWAEALFGAGLEEELLRLLELPTTLPIPAERLVAWEALLRRGGPRARLRLGEALLQVGRREGFALLEPLAQGEDPALALQALGHLAYYKAEPLLGEDLAGARAHLEKGLSLLDRVKGELAGRFLNDAARVPYEEGRMEEAEAFLEEALRRLPPESPYRLAPLVNLAFLRFEREGSLLGRIAALEEAVGLLGPLAPANLAGHLRDLGRLYLLLGEREKARDYLQRAQEAQGHPLASLEARMLLAHLEEDARGSPGWWPRRSSGKAPTWWNGARPSSPNSAGTRASLRGSRASSPPSPGPSSGKTRPSSPRAQRSGRSASFGTPPATACCGKRRT